MDKKHILNEIRNAAEANGGVTPGKTKFFQLTGIKESDWAGKFWIRWSEALKEAGLTPNKMQGAFSDEHILERYALLVRKLNHVPTSVELRMHVRNTADFPSHNTFNRFGSKARLIGKLIDYCENIANYEDILPLLKATRHELPSDPPDAEGKEPEEGYVYLMKFGNEYKIGTSNNVERRY